MSDPEGEVRKGAERIGWLPLWRKWLRFVIPVVLLLILMRTVPAAIGTVQAALATPVEDVEEAVDDVPVVEGAAPPMEEAVDDQ